MSHDEELDRLKAEVSCAVLLERSQPPWLLDKRESTRDCLKYRRGNGEVLIVNHQGRGWWDPQLPPEKGKGDVFALVQHLQPGLHFGRVRQVLRPLAGIAASYPGVRHDGHRTEPKRPPSERWNDRPRLRRASKAWVYLATERRLPGHVLERASGMDVVRDGSYGSAWFAHRDDAGRVSHVEVRGPGFKGSLTGGSKRLFGFGAGEGATTRLAVVEAPIDALSLAALEGVPSGTRYVATGGGMGPGTEGEILRLIQVMAATGSCQLVSGTDANKAGDRYALRHAALAAAAGVAYERLRPPEGLDWNDVLKGRQA